MPPEGQDEPPRPLDVAPLIGFICGLCPVALGTENFDGFREYIESPVPSATLRQFAEDAELHVVVVQKRLAPAEGEEEPKEIFSLTTAANASEGCQAAVAFIKREEATQLVEGVPLYRQLLFLKLTDQRPFEVIHGYVHASLLPLIESYQESGASDDRELPSVKRKVAELELSFRNLQDEADIPEIDLPIDPEIEALVQEVELQKHRATDEQKKALTEDTKLLDRLEERVQQWIAEIQKVTEQVVNKDTKAIVSVSQEINYWLSVDRALAAVQRRLHQEGIDLTLDVLRMANRFRVTVAFESDKELKKAVDDVTNYNVLLKELPINDLLAASSLADISSALQEIFQHLKKLRLTRYKIKSALLLVGALSRDLLAQMLRVLSKRRLFYLPVAEFNETVGQCRDIFVMWDDLLTNFKEMARELARNPKRNPGHSEDRLPIRVPENHEVLKTRLTEVDDFRRNHEEFRAVLRKCFPSGGAVGKLSPLDEITAAFADVRDVPLMDVSTEGEKQWRAAEKRYLNRLEKVEVAVTKILRERLSNTKNANEMFFVFEKYGDLLGRPKVAKAVEEFQLKFVERAQGVLDALKVKFKSPYVHSKGLRMDLTPVAGKVIWCKQMELQVHMTVDRALRVFGSGSSASSKLKQDADEFLALVNPQKLYDTWVDDAEKRAHEVAGEIFLVKEQRGAHVQEGDLAIVVNFSHRLVTLYKEVRSLESLGYRPPYVVMVAAERARKLHPYASSLTQILDIYRRTQARVTGKYKILAAHLVTRMQRGFVTGFDLHWDAEDLGTYVQRLAEMAVEFQDAVDLLIEKVEEVEENIAKLPSCPLQEYAFVQLLDTIQGIIDEMQTKNFSNMLIWVEKLDSRIEEIFVKRLSEAVQLWVREFKKTPEEILNDEALYLNEDGPLAAKVVLRQHMVVDGRPAMGRVGHDINMRNQVIFMDPPIEQARIEWTEWYNVWLGMFSNLRRLRAGPLPPAKGVTYTTLLTRLPNHVMLSAYEAIEEMMDAAEEYQMEVYAFQDLWDLQPEQVYRKLGSDLKKWTKLLSEMDAARRQFRREALDEKNLGPVVIFTDNITKKINDKYEAVLKQFLAKFSLLLGEGIFDLHAVLASARGELEACDVEACGVEAGVAFVVLVQGFRRKLRHWEADVKLFSESEALLNSHAFSFPEDWLHATVLEGEWTAFNEMLRRQQKAISTQIPIMRKEVLAEDRAIEEAVGNLCEEWVREKPIGGMSAEEAREKISSFESRIKTVREAYEKINAAKEALDLECNDEDKMTKIDSQLEDVRAIWSDLDQVWDVLGALLVTRFADINTRKLKNQLEEFVHTLKGLPGRARNTQAWTYVYKLVQHYQKLHSIVEALRSDPIKKRHWVKFKAKLKVDWPVDGTLTLQAVYDVDLKMYEKDIMEIVHLAQGEMGLESFLKEMSQCWSEWAVQLIPFQNKCKVIKGWDDLFNKVLEHLSSLSAMKGSPFYKTFAEEANAWDNRLNMIRAVFDVWLEVQRRWVYLAGIFSGSADIQVLLPKESAMFKEVDKQFMHLMKKTEKEAMVLAVIAIENIQESLERMLANLTKIQKALGEYLERQRSSFPRFYFIGDEDLLEIIGNSKDITKTMKHLKKMFAGVNSLLLSEDEGTILGIASSQLEEIQFVKPVVIKEHPKINEWLTLVEDQMRLSLAVLLTSAVEELRELWRADTLDVEKYFAWVVKYPDQLVTLATQVCWTDETERVLAAAQKGGRYDAMEELLQKTVDTLERYADAVLTDLLPNTRKKYEHVMMEMIHERDSLRSLLKDRVHDPASYTWLYNMRFYFYPDEECPERRLVIRMSNAEFHYGFEYLGIIEKLVHTPLTDRAYTTLTQALSQQMGGAPFGPAGTGKTESVKALGAQLGRFVLVFCCDENFDFQAMGRIFIGLCQVGAWGCFDEFNRLTEKMLSAVSQQIQTMQLALAAHEQQVELLGLQVKLNPNVGVFITMNPGYAGRSNLPDNLKQLVRSIAMTVPDKELIGQVMLFSQGFKTAERLAGKVVPLFKLCKEQLSSQSHYEFGLRSLKSVLISAGNVKRARKKEAEARGEGGRSLSHAELVAEEQDVQIQAVCETLIPKLVAEDIPLLRSLLSDVFPNCTLPNPGHEQLKREVRRLCKERNYVYSELWVEKMMQLYQITNLNHGLMLVGPSGGGKSSAWKVLLKALEAIEGREGVSYIIDPKAITVTELYGSMDPNTREWSDGLLTSIVRAVIDNQRGELNKRHWVIFDGEVDPMWVENMNSLLDDNKLLTLPNGERLALPSCMRIIFEVQDLKEASPATVSRCGMVWFSEDTVSVPMLYENYLLTLRNVELNFDDDAGAPSRPAASGDSVSRELAVQREVADVLAPYFAEGALVDQCMARSAQLDHVMDWTRLRVLNSMFSLVNRGVWNVHLFNREHEEYPMSPEQMKKYIERTLVSAIVWGLSGSCKISVREEFGEWIRENCPISLPPGENNYVLDNEVDVETGEWSLWTKKVPVVEVKPEEMGSAIIPTLDTVRHVECLFAWLAEHRPLLLCGPPGSGKTMTLFSTLRKAPNYECVPINFSSTTSPDLILQTLEQKCQVNRAPEGLVMSPKDPSKWLVMFCDEINLPEPDEYKTVIVLTFIRQMVEQNGFWRTEDLQWITLRRIQFCGACNPPTDPGRTPLSYRFLRWAPLILCDYPAFESLTQIYGTFARGFLKPFPEAIDHAPALTRAMVTFYTRSQKRFTPDQQQHYIYSPRELTRWVRGIYSAVKDMDYIALPDLVRLWAHEGLRLFMDRLVTDEERSWTNTSLDEVANDCFPNLPPSALARPILYSTWLSEGQKRYEPVTREALRKYLLTQLPKFREDEVDIPLVIFNEVLDHVLRIDRVFNQKQGHVLMIGQSGSGKTLLSRFMAWHNKLSVFMIHTSLRYSGDDFDEDLRTVLRRSGAEREKLCFIFDESNIKDTGFLERMNTLLANGEIPGLFEGDEYTNLMNQCKTSSSLDGLILDSEEELYDWFTKEIIKNLHVVFTMNPAGEGWTMRKATSPALFNRCVLNWYGDWTSEALFQVGLEFTDDLDVKRPDYAPPETFPPAFPDCPLPPTHHQALVNAMVYVHLSVDRMNKKLAKRQGRINYVTPRHFLDMLAHYLRLFKEVQADLRDQQAHLNGGLHKLIETEEQVKELQTVLAARAVELEEKQVVAAAKLKQMVADQQEAAGKKEQAARVAEELAPKLKEVMKAKAKANADIEKAEPMVSAAADAVRNIKKSQLQEVQSLNKPPEGVRLTMEAVCMLMGAKTTEWSDIRKMIKKDGFLQNVMSFDTFGMDPKLRQQVKTKYVDDPNFTFEKINKASKACGPLCSWCIAQVSYSKIIEDVEPLRRELAEKEAEAATGQAKKAELDATISGLEKKLAELTAEYERLMAEIDRMKREAELTNRKVARSSDLLQSLASESTRWQEAANGFETQMRTVPGDCLLAAAFLAYAGFFDQSYRANLGRSWSAQLKASGVDLKGDLSVVNLCSTADERLEWVANSLPDDEMCTENAIMLMRYNRYPLLVDPSGQAVEFMVRQYPKMIKTSFMEKNFVKTLETALRFGNPLLVQDVENIDPIVNPILNKEVKKVAGRTTIALGKEELDISPAFELVMATRDPTYNFAPDICSRVTFVNFTVTPGSLQAQCLSRVLKVERADIDNKRTNMLKLQGEFRVRLRKLEDRLLKTLSESEGNILDNDAAIGTLETLKKETKEVEEQMEKTEETMAEISLVSGQYDPLAASCARVYFAMEQLSSIHFLYQFSLAFFMQIFEYILLSNPNLEGVEDHDARIALLVRDLFTEAYRRVARTLLNDDRLCFAITLAMIRLDAGKDPVAPEEFDLLLKGSNASRTLALPDGMFTELQSKRLGSMATLAAYDVEAAVARDAASFTAFCTASAPETACPDFASSSALPSTPARAALRTMVLCRAVRPDRVLVAGERFVAAALGQGFLDLPPMDFARIALEETTANQPLLLCSLPGFDPSGNVDELAASKGKKMKSVSIGSPEGFELADKGISQAAKTGAWVLLKNVHLAPQWLVALEKRMLDLEAHKEFRLFLTAEINPRVPVNLMRMSRILVFEPPPGVKANLLRSFSLLPPARMDGMPVERARLYFLVAWLHAMVQERLRYRPLGWAQSYEFNDADQRCGYTAIDYWVRTVAPEGEAHVDPERIPFDALRTLMSQSIYGGKIDNEFDNHLLEAFMDKLFTPASFSPGAVLVPADGDKAAITAPQAEKHAEYVAWVRALPDGQTPVWLGLPNNAEKVLLATKGGEMISKVAKSQGMVDDDDEADEPAAAAASAGGEQEKDSRPAWMRSLHARVLAWSKLLPESLPEMAMDDDLVKNPLVRCIHREVLSGGRLLRAIRRDLGDLDAVMRGDAKQTNHLRALLTDLSKETTPPSWRKYAIPNTLGPGTFIVDFVARCAQLARLATSSDYGKNGVCMGKLLVPEAFLTASAQAAAQSESSWSLEELVLTCSAVGEATPCTFVVEGMSLDGAEWDGTLRLSSEMSTNMPPCMLHWRHISDVAEQGNLASVPVYLNEARDVLLFNLNLQIPPDLTPNDVWLKGVAIILVDYSKIVV